MSAFSGGDVEPVRAGEETSDSEEHVDEGSNLVDSRPSVLIREPVLLDLSRELVEAKLFDSYTYTGVIFIFFSQYISPFQSCYRTYYRISRNFITFAQFQTL